MPYHVRVAIDNKINVGHWYNVRGRGSQPPEILLVEDEPDRPVSVYITPGVSRLDCSVLPLSCTGTLGFLYYIVWMMNVYVLYICVVYVYT